MLEFIQSVHVLTGVFLLAAFTILLIFGIRGLRWATTTPPNDRQAVPRYAYLLRKISI